MVDYRINQKVKIEKEINVEKIKCEELIIIDVKEEEQQDVFNYEEAVIDDVNLDSNECISGEGPCKSKGEEKVEVMHIEENEVCSHISKTLGQHRYVNNEGLVLKSVDQCNTNYMIPLTEDDCSYLQSETIVPEELKLDSKHQCPVSPCDGGHAGILHVLHRNKSPVERQSNPNKKICPERHFSVNHTGGPDQLLTCAKCNETFANKYTLTTHEQAHTGDLFNCSQCPFKSPRKYKLDQHLRSKHTGDYYSCTECPRKYTRRAWLENHFAARHEKSQVARCSVCPSTLASQHQLSSHVRDQLFVCTECAYRTGVKRNLKVHMRIHVPERPYSCPHCAYAAKLKCTLNSHVAKVHYPTEKKQHTFACHICQYVTDSVIELANHLAMHMK